MELLKLGRPNLIFKTPLKPTFNPNVNFNNRSFNLCLKNTLETWIPCNFISLIIYIIINNINKNIYLNQNNKYLYLSSIIFFYVIFLQYNLIIY